MSLYSSNSVLAGQHSAAGSMDEEVKRNVLEVIQLACDTHGNSREAVARSIKQQLDRQLAPNWQVIVGKTFVCNVSYEKSTLGYFEVGPHKVVVFKAACF
ncbi:hypothetical protein BOX15_Mlig011254g1 [Macrostomum lignano]|uniref:Dynein light chain n=1 Tax=Macrostomum lignano TaxID=282301 RepID=A0A267EWY7_9PLAT|nr:hypothetical protein BOX15_Mlig011254g1 [Macrostomum lignano]